MKWWLTGSTGLVGAALIKQHGLNLVGSDRKLDISNRDACLKFVKVHGPFVGIINCAAFSKVDLAETHREEALLANGVGPEVLGKIASDKKMKMIHLSTDYVFAGDGNRPLKESDETGPCNYYGLSKLEGEKRLIKVNPDACILRTSWVFGIGGNNFASLAIKKLATEERLKLVSDQISRPTFVKDLVDVIWQMKEKKGIYQFANQGEASKFVFAKALKEELLKKGIKVKCQIIEPCLGSEFPAAAQRPKYTPFDTSKIENEMGIYSRSWQKALCEFVEEADVY